MSFLENIKTKLSSTLYPDSDANLYAESDFEDADHRSFQEPDASYSSTSSYAHDSSYAPSSYSSSSLDEGGFGSLGQTHRGEADSVTVFTRSGKPVEDTTHYLDSYEAYSSYDSTSPRPGAYDTPSSYAQARDRAATRSARSSMETATPTSTLIGTSPRLPLYVLRPESYDDVETVVRRVRTRQPVALVFVGVRTEVAKRVLDFSYGFACGLGASVREAGDRVFVVLPSGCELYEADLAKLRREGYLKG